MIGRHIIVFALFLLYPLKPTAGQEYSSSFLAFLNEGIRVGRDIAYLENIDNNVKLLKQYDFIIVGAGTAGCTLAARLSENPAWKVLLLEAGGPENLAMDIPIIANLLQANHDINWAYRTQPSDKFCTGLKDQRCNFPRGKVMGGSSVLNYMIYTRGNRRDYDTWAELGNEGWSYQDVLPYFKKLEGSIVPDAEADYVGRRGPVKVSYPKWHSPMSEAFVKAVQEAGSPYLDYNGKRQVGVAYTQTTTDQSYRWSANRAYLYPIKGKRPNLHIRKYSMATKIIIDPKTKTALGVVFESNGQTFEVLARLEVISSGGAINTPQLLMLSGVGPAKHLRQLGIKPVADLAVGYNLQDHIAPGLNIVTNATTIRVEDFFDFDQLIHIQTTHDSKLSIPGGLEAIAFYDLDHPTDPNGWPDIELLTAASSFHENPFLAQAVGIRGDILQAFYEDVIKQGSNVFMIVALLLRPRSKGRILLRSKDPKKYPLIYPNYLNDPYDLDITVRGLQKIIELVEQPSMRRINATILDRSIPQCRQHGDVTSREYLECYVRELTFTIYHQSGTAKMGPKSDRMAVVDPRLRVYGIKNLRVVDASIMPKIIAGHTNGPTYMIAEKAADMIKQDHGFV